MSTRLPPRLRLHVAHHLKLLVAFNFLPIFIGMWLTWQWHTGKMSLRALSPEAKTSIIVVLAALLILTLNTWFFAPMARWLRDYAAWYLRRGPAWAWIIPTFGGWLAWIASMFAQAASILVAGLGIWQVIQKSA